MTALCKSRDYFTQPSWSRSARNQHKHSRRELKRKTRTLVLARHVREDRILWLVSRVTWNSSTEVFSHKYGFSVGGGRTLLPLFKLFWLLDISELLHPTREKDGFIRCLEGDLSENRTLANTAIDTRI